VSTNGQYDVIILGAGQAGVPLSTALAGAGRKVALVEREHVGGSCINEGCTPTKTMVASAQVAYLANRAADYGVQTGEVGIDMRRVRQRKRDIVHSFRSSNQRRIDSAEGLDLLMGEGRFTGPKTIEVALNAGGTRRLTAEKIFINTGARPFIPPIPGLEGVPYLDSTTIMELGEVPEHLLIAGGGYVGVEFGQMFRRFGSAVTIVQRGEQLLSHEDHDVAQAVADILREDGIEVLLESDVKRAELEEGGRIKLTVSTADGEPAFSGSHLLVATGRRPNTEALNLEAAGVETDERGHVKVNARLETNVPGIYALGDVKDGPAFTHISYDDYRIVRTNLLDGGDASIEGRLIPYVVFIDPQLGRVGLTEKQAQAQGHAYRVAKMPMSYVARALEVDQPRGLMKALVDADSDEILGIAVLGIEGGEIMAIVEVAMMGHLPYTALRDGIFAHPTLSESLNTLFFSFED
jgi:pyruvate/2-oxoglutarate dehydrogenase complex dihydrolipoamide dehydrogenase (E3) component